MNILFVHSIDDIFSPAKPLRTPEQMQFGISYISSLLKKHGHETRLLVLSRMLGRKNNTIIQAYLREFYPQLICFTAVSSEYPFIAQIARDIKDRYPRIYLLLGGVHASLNPGESAADDFDALCIGEGEYPTLELAGQLERGVQPAGIANLWLKRGSVVEKNPPRLLLRDLDSLPFPDREMWREWIEEEKGARYPVLLGRGCPFECAYCCNHALKKIADGPYVRMRAPQNILAELREIIVKYPRQRDIYLEVETIGADKEWALSLCGMLEALNARLERPLTFGVNLRVTPGADFATLFAAFKKSNFKVVNLGVESGNERVRREILNRRYFNEDITQAVSCARRYGLKVHLYNLIGIPGETQADFQDTLKINRMLKPDKVYTHIFFPYPGTKLYSYCREQGLLKNKPDCRQERCRAVLDLPGFSRRQIEQAFVWFEYNVYKGYKPLYRILGKVLVSQCKASAWLHYCYKKITRLFLFRWLTYMLRQCI